MITFLTYINFLTLSVSSVQSVELGDSSRLFNQSDLVQESFFFFLKPCPLLLALIPQSIAFGLELSMPLFEFCCRLVVQWVGILRGGDYRTDSNDEICRDLLVFPCS